MTFKRFAITFVVALTLVIGLNAQTKMKAPQKSLPARTTAILHQEGTVLSLTATELKLSEEKAGRKEEMTFALSTATKREGRLAAGSHVRVTYEPQGGHNMATSIASIQMAPSNAKRAPVRSKAKTK